MKVAIVMGSISDKEVVQKTREVLKKFQVPHEVRILSAHRTPKEVEDFIQQAEQQGVEVVIAAAGKAAHLAGVIAGKTTLPVVGIPMKTGDLGGMDSLLSVVQMPKGIPVATVAISGGENAGILAIQMLSIKYPKLKEALQDYKEEMRQGVLEKDEAYAEQWEGEGNR